MNERERHPIEAIHALVDDRLDAGRRAEVERHLEHCPSCRAEREVAEATVRTVRSAMPTPDLPPGLATRLTAALDDADRREVAAPSGRRRGAWRWLAPVAIAALLALAFVLLRAPGDAGPVPPPSGEAIVADADADLGAILAGTLPLDRTDLAPPALEAYFEERGIAFETRVFDLGMMGYDLVGGRVEDLAGRTSALFVYRGADGVLMVCRMYLGTLDELPAPDRAVEHDGIAFRVYERDGRTLVFWEEGEVVCVLASDGPPQAVLDLSFAKAVKV